MKKNFNILFGIGAVNLVNGALLTLTPTILKDYISVGSLWFIGTFLTLNTLVVNFGSSLTFLNKFTNKLDYNKITYAYLIFPFLLMWALIIFKNPFFLILYFAIFSILGILRNISLSNVTMLDKNNKFLIKSKNLIATITSIIGLTVAQLLLDKSLESFMIAIAIVLIISFIILFINQTDIQQKKFARTKRIKVSNYKKVGIYLGLSKGLSLMLIAIINFYIVLHTSQYGYIKVFEAIFSICVIYMSSVIVKLYKVDKLISFRGVILLVPLLGVMLISAFSDITFSILLIVTFTISVCNSSEEILINSIFEKVSKKDANKHLYLFSYYYKFSTLFLLVSAIITFIIDFQNTSTMLNFAFLISGLIILTTFMFNNNLKKLLHS